MRILITGITGFIGTHLAEHASKQKNVEVFGFRRLGSKKPAYRAAQLFDCDICDEKKIALILKKIKPSHIFHLAGISSVSQSWENPETTFRINVGGTRSLLESVVKNCPAARVLVASSAEVYGSSPSERKKFDENSPFRPKNPYAVSKIAQEFTAYQYFLNHKLFVVRTRAFNHIGPGQSEVYVASNFAKQVAQIEAHLQEATLEVGNLNVIRDFLDVRDGAEAYWQCLEKGTSGDVYNISSGIDHKVGEMLKYYLKQSAVTIKIKKKPSRVRAVDVAVLVGNSNKLWQKTGWQLKFSFEETLSDILNDWRHKLRSEIRNK